MKKMIFSLVAGLALVGRPTPATATTLIRCLIDSVAECDARFPPSDYRNVSIRGWCYIITTGICRAM